MRIFFSVMLISICFLLSGCPTPFQKLESLYFKDRYTAAILESDTILRKMKEVPELTRFLKRNMRRAKKTLRPHYAT